MWLYSNVDFCYYPRHFILGPRLPAISLRAHLLWDNGHVVNIAICHLRVTSLMTTNPREHVYQTRELTQLVLKGDIPMLYVDLVLCAVVQDQCLNVTCWNWFRYDLIVFKYHLCNTIVRWHCSPCCSWRPISECNKLTLVKIVPLQHDCTLILFRGLWTKSNVRLLHFPVLLFKNEM